MDDVKKDRENKDNGQLTEVSSTLIDIMDKAPDKLVPVFGTTKATSSSISPTALPVASAKRTDKESKAERVGRLLEECMIKADEILAMVRSSRAKASSAPMKRETESESNTAAEHRTKVEPSANTILTASGRRGGSETGSAGSRDIQVKDETFNVRSCPLYPP